MKVGLQGPKPCNHGRRELAQAARGELMRQAFALYQLFFGKGHQIVPVSLGSHKAVVLLGSNAVRGWNQSM